MSSWDFILSQWGKRLDQFWIKFRSGAQEGHFAFVLQLWFSVLSLLGEKYTKAKVKTEWTQDSGDQCMNRNLSLQSVCPESTGFMWF